MDIKKINNQIIEQLSMIFDPEIPVNIYELGLIYNIAFEEETEGLVAKITMTLTSAACPVSESLVDQVRNVGYLIDELARVDVNLVFDPPWTQESMSDEARLQLGML
jgi:metal-sulfur cluster biosynthetic enzyme